MSLIVLAWRHCITQIFDSTEEEGEEVEEEEESRVYERTNELSGFC